MEWKPDDKFGPVTTDSKDPIMVLPSNIDVKFVGSEKDVAMLKDLVGSSMIGIDTEWRPTLTQFEEVIRPGLIQLSNENTAYLIDIVNLNKNPALDAMLSQIFTHPDSLIIGFCFHGDLELLADHLPDMHFYKTFTNFIDAQAYFTKIQKLVNNMTPGLSTVAKTLFGKDICKQE